VRREYQILETRLFAHGVPQLSPQSGPIMEKELTGLPGKHRHNAHTFVYVLEGTIVMQVAGGEAVTLGPGQTFYASPEDIHLVSKNASDSQPAKFLVFFVQEKGAPSVVPVQ
jgi:quercetin dioxygenase-like cupin family protein